MTSNEKPVSIVRLPAVKDRTGLGRSTIYHGVKEGTFPAPIQLTARAVGWNAQDIDTWLAVRVAASKRIPKV